MSTQLTIRGVPVVFPFEPYPIQKDYMEKVIECLQTEQNGILESPTGTGKTLSLLCSSLAWLKLKQADVHAQRATLYSYKDETDFLKTLNDKLSGSSSSTVADSFRWPTIIYASRTHSQLSQAMQELKRTAYCDMKASVLGSRDQLCIHPEITQEQGRSAKVHMCRLKVSTRSCHFYNRVESNKDKPAVTEMSVIDIEDLVKVGKTHRFCPYYMSKELRQRADIVFTPYNYLLDPLARKALGVVLTNNIVILDEAHNIESVCEDSASLQIKTTDIALCIEEVTEIMKAMASNLLMSDTVQKDFSADELCWLKEKLLQFEKAMDSISLSTRPEGTTFDGDYIFELLEKADITIANRLEIINLIDKIIQFLTAVQDGPFQRKGNGLQLFEDLLILVFASQSADFRTKIKKCYRVHMTIEEPKKKGGDDWLSKAASKTKQCRVLNYWCFSPGFGMKSMMAENVRCVILTSGTLAPLPPLISELEISVPVTLENPHVVKNSQVCVEILCKGPDMEILNSNFQNRDNPKYLASLGRSILNLSRLIPNGLLIFFPSYPIMQKCQQSWQEDGTWGHIRQQKAIFVEPRDKDAFNSAMTEYYAKIRDPALKGAIFMGVCRGKVSEGLDFADINGRGVIITGLPYPPLKDPRVILKRRYLDICNSTDKQFPRGEEWYSMQATRAVNQAIGRVIRHQHDYGAILLLDTRFTSPKMKSSLSLWLRNRVKVVNNFGEIIGDLRRFFKNAETELPSPKLKQLSADGATSTAVPASFDVPTAYKKNFDFSTSTLFSSGNQSLMLQGPEDVTQKRSLNEPAVKIAKRKKISIVPERPSLSPSEVQTKEYIIMVKSSLSSDEFKMFIEAISTYDKSSNFEEFTKKIDKIFVPKHNLRHIIQGLQPYIKRNDKTNFDVYWEKMR